MSRILIQPADPDSQADVLALLANFLPPTLQELRVVEGLELLRSGKWDPSLLLTARHSPAGPMVGAVFAEVVPGGGAVVYPPRTHEILDSDEVEKLLIHGLVSRVRARGTPFCQAILSVEDEGGVGALARNGFLPVTRIWAMHQSLRKVEAPAEPRACGSCRVSTSHPIGDRNGILEFVPYSPADESTFLNVLLRTFHDSLDCPELNSALPPRDVLSAYRVSAPDLSRWWLLRHAGEDVGLLLLSDADPETWEIAYLGLVPEHRGKGYGRSAMQCAMNLAASAGKSALSLIVDVRNEPAIQLYRSLGFQTTHIREVLLLFGLQQECGRV